MKFSLNLAHLWGSTFFKASLKKETSIIISLIFPIHSKTHEFNLNQNC